jgi:hypothetical protein
MRSGFRNVSVKIRVPRDWGRDEIRKALKPTGIEPLTIKLSTRPGAAKGKGTQFEREFARLLSAWWTRGQDEAVFRHRSGSGGAAVDLTGDSGHSGDVYADKEVGLPVTQTWSFELKWFEDLTACVWTVFTRGENRLLERFWEQGVLAAEPYGRKTILVLRTNQRKPLMVTNDRDLGGYLDGLQRVVAGSPVTIFPMDDFLTMPMPWAAEQFIHTDPPQQKALFKRLKRSSDDG